MFKIEDLEKELAEHWNKTAKKRKLTHTAVLYEKSLKNKSFKKRMEKI